MAKVLIAFLLALSSLAFAADSELSQSVAQDYETRLKPLFEHFHRNPELSFQEFNTSARLARELRAAGFEVTEGVGKTGVVAIMKNGPGPLVMMRADMDALPVEEKTGLPYASQVVQKDEEGKPVKVMHACGHDVHITSLVGIAHQMAARHNVWSGTLMLVGQPAEERLGGASAMKRDQLWKRFGQPDVVLAFHVASGIEAGKIEAIEGSPYSGVDTVEIIIHGVGAHGASPHRGKDPVVLGAQIVLALQTIITREISPREPALITVGSFHAGTRSNIIPDTAKLQLTVRSESPATRRLLLDAIRRVSLNTARAAGFPEDKLPEIIETETGTPPVINDLALTKRLKMVWEEKMGQAVFAQSKARDHMSADDFSFFITNPPIPALYFSVGGTPKADFERARNGGAAIPSHHSPLFKISPEPTIKAGVEASVTALLDLLKK